MRSVMLSAASNCSRAQRRRRDRARSGAPARGRAGRGGPRAGVGAVGAGDGVLRVERPEARRRGRARRRPRARGAPAQIASGSGDDARARAMWGMISSSDGRPSASARKAGSRAVVVGDARPARRGRSGSGSASGSCASGRAGRAHRRAGLPLVEGVGVVGEEEGALGGGRLALEDHRGGEAAQERGDRASRRGPKVKVCAASVELEHAGRPASSPSASSRPKATGITSGAFSGWPGVGGVSCARSRR